MHDPLKVDMTYRSDLGGGGREKTSVIVGAAVCNTKEIPFPVDLLYMRGKWCRLCREAESHAET